MNKITKRVVAGISAAALFVSALGSDALISLFNPTTYAASSDDSGEIGKDKNGQSTGFDNLEQDTLTVADGTTYYNTGYGLHTNKTATEADTDGRTFDVNLESWYVGENPVDVATILDASGSMAWTVDTLKPLSVSEQLDADDKSYLISKYGKDDLAAIQEENYGYLPQDVVDRILDPANTDNSKLSYADYMYYVYEARSSVSEFVPLGYWDGGDPAEKFEPIGYYPFNGNLVNKASGGTAATAISRVASDGTFSDTALDDVPIEVQFKNSGLSLSEVDKKGNVIIDLSKQLDTTDTITLSFEAYFDDIRSGAGTPFSPIISLGDGTNANYVGLFRGRSRNNSNGASRGLSLYDNKLETKNDNFLPGHYEKWLDCVITINGNNVKFSIKDGSTVLWTVDIECTLNLTSDKLYLILGGNEILPHGDLKDDGNDDIDPTNLMGNYIRNLEISGTSSAIEPFNAKFSLQNKEGLTDSEGNGMTAKYYQQSTGSEFDVTNLAVTSPVVYSGNALNLTKTAAKNSAVKLDAKPKDSTYTIMFKVKTSNKFSNGDRGISSAANLFYIGSMYTTENYYRIGISDTNDPRNLQFFEKNSQLNLADSNHVFENANTTKYVAYVIDGATIKSYFLDETGTTVEHKASTTRDNALGTKDINIILAGLIDQYTFDADISIDDLYIFDDALSEEQVKIVAEKTGQTKFAKVPSKLADGCKGYHATTEIDGKDVDIAQIKDSLAQNPNDDEREGWYYVNSHSTWADIEGCLASGKQYIGIYDKDDENGIDHVVDVGKDIATIPSAYEDTTNAEYQLIKQSIEDGNTDSEENSNRKFNEAPENERSIRFYVDSQNHLRCFAWSGSTSKDTDLRTFCSLVYEKKDDQITKYEELNKALNTFYENLADKSDLSNNAVVRFSTNSAIGDNETATNTNLQKLIMKDWTNWSDYYQKYKEEHPGTEAKTTDYLQNLLIPDDDETAVPADPISTEYPYVMTGGTYTWTGLKAFYDNMVNNEDSQTAKVIANDARDKYLIIFTDGRDNTQDYNVSEATAGTPAGSPDYNDSNIGKTTFGKKNYVEKYNPYKGEAHKVGFSIEYYDETVDAKDLVPQFKTEDHGIESDGDLAEAWADKLKDEGYTIYCVMMASGSISPSANADEYNKAKNFLKSLSGSNELDEEIAQRVANIPSDEKPDAKASMQRDIEALRDDYVIVVDPTATDSITVTQAFEQILEDIQLPRNDYTVQDYIDPRFDLIGEAYVNAEDEEPSEVIYHLGANGEITFTDKNNLELKQIQVAVPNSSTRVTLNSGDKAGNIIDNITNTKIKGFAYTPIESYMVNREASEDPSYKDGYDDGNIGTGYLYYDDVKDMYYLRWTDQIIPMENEAFDTVTDPEGKKLDVWSATIRLKAKDDFIGGNNILTNGNEAGENLVYSDATIENMDKNPDLYFTGSELEKFKDSATGEINVPYRDKLEALSGTNRKINAVDTGGVSQAVYGDGIDIPSSGFPRTTVNVRLLPLNANNLNDVIYMGEVVSPTMMLADLENGYMTGSYYLQYLERYAYRVYGDKAGSTPLIELLNKWLKINEREVEAKTFTIPYIYLPDPEYNSDGTLAKVEGTDTVKLQNSTGWDSNKQGTAPKFDDLNLCDVTGFITYTWKRDDVDINGDGEVDQEPQQKDPVTGIYDITKDYVVKNTNQIKYNLQLKFTPLKETDLSTEFSLGENFINEDKFFTIENGEFIDSTEDKWTITPETNSNRTDYLQAMIQEMRTYEPHVMYDKDATGGGKWVLVDDKSTEFTPELAVEAYAEDEQTTGGTDGKTVIDSGVYDWDSDYKKAPGNVQLEKGDLTKYTSTPDNVNFANAKGEKLSEDGEPVSLAANTTYTKDVVNAALALELFVDGKYLKKAGSEITNDKTFTFEATRYYNDPYDPLPYGSDIDADTGVVDPTGKVEGKKYRLTFKVTDIPADATANELSRVWANLTKVEVEDDTSGYVNITNEATASNPYLGYDKPDALPIGTYVIDTATNPLNSDIFKIADVTEGGLTETLYFKYLKIDNDVESYTYDRFPDNVSEVSSSAVTSTGDGEYQIWNDPVDYSKKNIAENNRTKDAGTQTVTFYFGTVKDDSGNKGESVKDYLKANPKATSSTDFTSDYAKDRLGIIMLSADNNSLAISKKVTNTDDPDATKWNFKVTVKPDTAEDVGEFETQNSTGFELKWYKFNSDDGSWKLDETAADHDKIIKFDAAGDGTYTAIITLKHGEKVVISGLQDGTWQVEEEKNGTLLYTPHNNANGEENWEYVNSNITSADVQLNPASHVDFVNEFPYELPSAGGFGIVIFVVLGSLLSAAAVIFFVLGRRKAGYSAGGKECG